MKFGFKRETLLKMAQPINSGVLDRVTAELGRRYDVQYISTQNPDGFCLKPKARVTLRINSFWPKVTGTFTEQEMGTSLYVCCCPTGWVCSFFCFYTVFAAVMELACMKAAFTGGAAHALLLLPALLWVFAYLLFSVGTTVCARRVFCIMKEVL